MNLLDQQKKLKITLIDYELNKAWGAHPFIGQLRQKVIKRLPQGMYDPQDLEHQILFRLTTFDPADITDQLIDQIIEEQYLIVQDRLSKLNLDLEYLFRGLAAKYHDLNINKRLTLERVGDKLTAKNSYHSFTVEFRKIADEQIISLFTSELHYIHQDRTKGETFGLFFADDDIPWAIETTEPSVIAKEYKRESLLAHGIDPNKAIELTRFYTLPGAPLNAISIMDRLVAKYYQPKGIEALFTTTMPMYSKTKGATIAGGLNKVLLVKDLRHNFVPEIINGKTCYRHVTNIPADKRFIKDTLTTHPNFPTMSVVEVYRIINKPSLPPLDLLRDEKKVIYVFNRDYYIEQEIKFVVNDVLSILEKLKKNAKFSNVEYLRDIIYGCKNNPKKIRLRFKDTFDHSFVNVIYKYRSGQESNVKSEVEEVIYSGTNLQEALEVIKQHGDFNEENSYEKIRVVYYADKTELALDIYPYGTWLEIEGQPQEIWAMGRKLGFDEKDATTLNADELYLEWNKEMNLKELWQVRFGLQ